MLVVGGGPAGSCAARAAAEAGADVLLVEKEPSIAHTVRTSGVTWMKDARRFGLPRRLYNPVSRFAFCSPSRTVVAGDGRERAAVLDVRGAYRWFAQGAERAGARVLTSAAASGALVSGGRVTGATVASGGRASEIKARVTVDAGGFARTLSRSAGAAGRWRRFGAGAEYEVKAESVRDDTWYLMVGSAYSPAGYAWIFPLGGGRARVGVGVGRPESGADPRAILESLIERGAGPVGEMGKLEKTEYHYGLIPNDGPARRTVHDGLLMVGDAAGHANPLVLEGIRYAVRFGELAGRTAAAAAESGDCSARALGPYEKGWKKSVGSRLERAGRIQSRWMELDDEAWDAELDAVAGMSAGELESFMRADFGLVQAARLAVRRPRLLARGLAGGIRGLGKSRSR